MTEVRACRVAYVREPGANFQGALQPQHHDYRLVKCWLSYGIVMKRFRGFNKMNTIAFGSRTTCSTSSPALSDQI